MLIRRALENQRLLTENILLREEFSSRLGLPTIIGKSEKIVNVARDLQKAAPTKTTILILGESGTGKELFARAIHHFSGRGEYPFVPINCAAIPEELLESELFGHEKGAFTGAHARKLGKFELAHKGTVFLDEIGELDPGLQAKLLRALQEEEIERVGGTKAVKIDVRVIAASNKDLEREVAEKRFREDLYYRLSVFPIRVPPLRERPEDIPLIAEYFVRKYSADLKAGRKELSGGALRLLSEYEWKGNVRELENAIERAIILCDGNTINPEHISISPLHGSPSLREVSMEGALEEVARRAVRIVEAERIRQALKEAGGNKTRTAEMLKVSYKTLLTKIKDYGID
jgi:transcriptional regulator with GAF, ATPase, and Fis domain